MECGKKRGIFWSLSIFPPFRSHASHKFHKQKNQMGKWMAHRLDERIRRRKNGKVF